jgi:hypothetical protein
MVPASLPQLWLQLLPQLLLLLLPALSLPAAPQQYFGPYQLLHLVPPPAAAAEVLCAGGLTLLLQLQEKSPQLLLQ